VSCDEYNLSHLCFVRVHYNLMKCGLASYIFEFYKMAYAHTVVVKFSRNLTTRGEPRTVFL